MSKTTSFQNPFKVNDMPTAVCDGIRNRHTVMSYSFIVLLDGKPICKKLYQIPKGGFRSGMEKAWTYLSVLTPDGEWVAAYCGEGGCGYDKACSGFNHAANKVGIPRTEAQIKSGAWVSDSDIIDRLAAWHGSDRSHIEVVDLW